MSGVPRDPFAVSARKRALIEATLRKEGVFSTKAGRIVRRTDRGPAPLSFAQQRLWFFDQFEPGSSLYNLMAPVLFEGDLDADALEKAFNQIVERHEALRTAFDFRDGLPVQVVAAVLPVKLARIDLTGLADDEQQGKMQSLLREEAGRPFDLKRGPLLRTTLLRLNERKHVLLFAVHHIICDAWSTALLIHELGEIYAALRAGRAPSLPELPIQYSDFAVWQRQWLQGSVLGEQLDYWKRRLGADLPVLELPADRARPAVQTYHGSCVYFSLSHALSQSLKALGQSERATLFMTLLAAFKVLLNRYTGLEDISIGTPIANRQRQEIENLIGFFTNTLAIRTDLSGNPTFRDLLSRVRENLLEAYSHQDLPFEYLVEHLHPARTLSHSPLVQVMFVLKNTPEPELKLPGVTATPLKSDFATAKFDLTVYLDDRGDEIGGAIEYNTGLFDRERIERMSSHFQTLLAGIVANPAECISTLPLLTGAETEQVLVEWNRSQAPYPPICAHQLFEQQVERTPNSTALLFGKDRITYEQLNASANRIAQRLQALDAGPGTIAGILMERGPEMIAGILGILKAGAACLPLNPSYPAPRLAFMLEDSGAKAILAERRLAESLLPTTAHIVHVDSDWHQPNPPSDGNPQTPVDPESGVYVIYTSGSTGTPKGVLMPHRALVNLVQWHRESGSHSSRVLQFASLTFDVSFQEIFSTLAAGGALVLAPEPARVDMAALARLIAENQVERLHLPVIVLQKLAEEFWANPQPLASLREAMVGGEQLQVTGPIARLFERLHACVLHNHYGPSETHVVTDFLLSGPSTSWPALPPLGRPIPNVGTYVLGPHLQPAPVGVPGELYIGGECLAHGYLQRPELTAERFVPDPFSAVPGARLYKTNDIVRYLRSGDIEFLGRDDFQVKIRGMRIELGEIEVELLRHPGVREAVVTVRQDAARATDKKLAAYIVPHPNQALTAKQLRDFLRERLPEHMVPSYVLMLERFPLTSSGKINRLALPAPDQALEPSTDYAPPRTPVEKMLARIFAEVLGRPSVGILDNFFDLGGHSLMATQITSRVREAFRIELPVRRIFEEPTIGGLSHAILQDENERHRIERTAELLLELSAGPPATETETAAVSAIERASAEDRRGPILPQVQAPQVERTTSERVLTGRVLRTAPLSFSQQRLWFLDQYEPQSTLYNLPAALLLEGQLDVQALEGSLNEIVRRHESLRTSFGIADERPIQIIREPSPWKLKVVNLQDLPEQEREQTKNRMIAEEAEQPYDLTQGPLLRTQLLRMAPREHIFLVTMHHIVSDGWSLRVFIRELTALYDAYCNHVRSPLPDLSMQYADFAVWQRQWLQGNVLYEQLDYWKKQLADAPPLLEFPATRSRPAYKTFNGAAHVFQVPQDLTQDVVRLSRREGTTIFMTLLTAFYVLLYRYTGQSDIVIGTPIASRDRRELEDLIGFFVNTLALRMRIPEKPSFRELLHHVRETCLQAYTHQSVPFEKLVEELHPERSLSHSPLFQTFFHLQNVLTETLNLAGLSTSTVETEIRKAKFDLSLAMRESQDGLRGILNYNTDLFDADTAARVAAHYEALLTSAVASPDAQISSLPMLTRSEKQELLFAWNDIRRDYGGHGLVHEVLEEQARCRPEAAAVRFENTSLTYAELNRRANQLAHRLRKLGVGPETIVGLCVERSLEMMIGLLGILKAGGAYLALDSSYPKARLALMVEDARIKALVTQETLERQLPACGAPRVYLNAQGANLAAESSDNPVKLAGPENLAYVIYTSGSTGKPKGIMIEHAKLANYLSWANEFMFDDAAGPVPAVQGLTFDGSLKQVFAPLLRGLEIWVLSASEMADPLSLIQALSTHRDVRFSAVPSLWRVILDALESGQADLPAGTITRAFIGGEDLPKSVVERSFRLFPGLRLWNFYGPSETTATATAAFIAPGDPITIGRPIAGKKVHILDAHLQPVPVGVCGEIYIGREGLGRGYLHRPDLTAASFIPDPFSDEPGARLYQTHDRARYLPDGRIDFLGRSDHQVKLRGFRIELGEIAASLRDHSQVKEAVATIRKTPEGEPFIAAYVVPTGQPAPGVDELRSFLKERLPHYMVPSAWVHLDRLPLMPNGKLNLGALPEPERGRREIEAPFIGPRTALEQVLADIFAGVLGVSQVGIHDNFFALGGHSLLATRLVARIRKVFHAELPLRQFFEQPSVAEVAAGLAATETAPGQMEETASLLRAIESISVDDLEDLLRRKKAKEAR